MSNSAMKTVFFMVLALLLATGGFAALDTGHEMVAMVLAGFSGVCVSKAVSG